MRVTTPSYERPLFDENRFTWPERHGDPGKDARLPWFWFTDVTEARTFLALFTGVSILWVLLVANYWVMHSTVLTYAGVPVLWGSGFVYLRMWQQLCERAGVRLVGWQRWMAHWGDRNLRHCVRVAWDTVSDPDR